MSHHTVYPADVKIEDVTYSINKRDLVSAVTLHAASGEVIGLVGPNGAGKSTLLRVLYRSLQPKSGQVLLDGADIRSMSRRMLARALAAVPQEFPAEFELTAYDVAAMGRAPHQRTFGGDQRGDERIVTTSLEMVGMAEFAQQPFDRLSGGEKQRILIARALAQEPQLMVLDEPTNHLDMRHQFDLLALVRRLGMTVVAALHDLNLAARFCDQIYVLDQGSVVASGTPAEVFTESLLSRVYDVPVNVHTNPRTGVPAVLFGGEGGIDSAMKD